VVKLDLGVHMNGYIADTATTVDLGDHGRLVEASMSALDRAIERSKVGTPIHDIGAAIQAEIETRGFKPISNLTGHGLDQYQIHTPPTIPNIGTGSTLTLQDGMVFAIEPFASTGAGFVSEGRRIEIFSQVAVKPVRLPAARRLIDEVRGRRGLPFARRWTKGEKFEIAAHSLIKAGILHAYPVLHDVSGSRVSQHEHTLILLGDECIVTTR
jgi:methionyl aminopeptidase